MSRIRTLPRLLVVLALAVSASGVLAACGGGGDKTTATTQEQSATSETTTATTATTETQAAADGKQIFTANCASCHTLGDAGATGTVGPNLDQLKPNKSLVERTVTNGRGAMPPFEGALKDDEIKAVAEYVSEKAGS